MFFNLFTFLNACASGEVTCMRCFQDVNCSYCPLTQHCDLINESTCEKPLFEINRACVEALGRDAKDSVRYIVGFTIMFIAIGVDIAIRVWNKISRTRAYHISL